MAKTSLKHPASATARAPTRSSKRNAALHGPNDSPGYDTDGSATHASAATRKSDATRTSAARRSTLKRGNENTSRVGRAKKAAMPSLVRVGADVADSTVVGDDVAANDSTVLLDDVVAADSTARYPMRKRTPAQLPPSVIHTPHAAKGGGTILSPIVGSPDDDKTDDDDTHRKKKHRSKYANELDYSDKDNDFLLNDDDLNDETRLIEYMDTKRKGDLNGNRQRRGNLILGGPECRDTTNMTEDEKRQYRKTRKEYTDRLRIDRMKRDPEDTLPSDDFTGCCTPHLCTEAEVEFNGLQVGHTFPTKDLLVMRIAEEANLRAIEFLTSRSDVLTVKCHGTRFNVEAHHSELNGWRVRVCATRDAGTDAIALLDSGDDNDDTPVYVPKSPYRTKWIKDLIRDTIAEMPMATNQVLRQQLAQYGKPYAITDALLQSARSQLRTTIFGDPEENCKYAGHVKDALEAEGHIVKLRITSRRETIQNIKRIVIGDELLRLKEFDGSTILPLERSAFVDKWLEEHDELLVKQLGSKNDGFNFLNGIFSFAQKTLPFL